MSSLYEEVRTTMGEYLDAVQARFLSEERIDEGAVAFLAIKDRIIAIRNNRRDGLTCFVSESEQSLPYLYNEWGTITQKLGLVFDLSTSEGTREFMSVIPEGWREYCAFIGKCLLKFFTTGEYA